MRVNITFCIYKAHKHSDIIEINIVYFLVCEPTVMSQIGGELL